MPAGKPLTRTVLLDCVANLLQVGVDRSDHLLRQTDQLEFLRGASVKKEAHRNAAVVLVRHLLLVLLLLLLHHPELLRHLADPANTAAAVALYQQAHRRQG